MTKETIYICDGRWCCELGSQRIFDRVKAFFTTAEVTQCRCLGYCETGVNAMKNGRVYHELTEENAIEELQCAGRQRTLNDIEFTDDFLGDI